MKTLQTPIAWNDKPVLSLVTTDSPAFEQNSYLDESHVWEKLNECISYTDYTYREIFDQHRPFPTLKIPCSG